MVFHASQVGKTFVLLAMCSMFQFVCLTSSIRVYTLGKNESVQVSEENLKRKDKQYLENMTFDMLYPLTYNLCNKSQIIMLTLTVHEKSPEMAITGKLSPPTQVNRDSLVKKIGNKIISFKYDTRNRFYVI